MEEYESKVALSDSQLQTGGFNTIRGGENI